MMQATSGRLAKVTTISVEQRSMSIDSICLQQTWRQRRRRIRSSSSIKATKRQKSQCARLTRVEVIVSRRSECCYLAAILLVLLSPLSFLASSSGSSSRLKLQQRQSLQERTYISEQDNSNSLMAPIDSDWHSISGGFVGSSTPTRRSSGPGIGRSSKRYTFNEFIFGEYIDAGWKRIHSHCLHSILLLDHHAQTGCLRAQSGKSLCVRASGSRLLGRRSQSLHTVARADFLSSECCCCC